MKPNKIKGEKMKPTVIEKEYVVVKRFGCEQYKVSSRGEFPFNSTVGSYWDFAHAWFVTPKDKDLANEMDNPYKVYSKELITKVFNIKI